MRLLAISDIHGNMKCVHDLRAREENRFDGIILAGDIGSATAAAIMDILSSFRCPIFYVYGNHDHELDYELDLGPDCYHLHLRCIPHGPFMLCGFSGCPTKWGQNPYARIVKQKVESKFEPMLAELAEARDALEKAENSILIAAPLTKAAEDIALEKLAVKSRAKGLDRRSSEYRLKADRIRMRYSYSTSKWSRAVSKIENSIEYQTYCEHWQGAYAEILRLNRQALLDALDRSGERENALIVTHERFPGATDDFPGVPLFAFGHRHGFTDTLHRGSRFVNVSVLDNEAVFRPKHLADFKWRNCKVVNRATYAVIEARNRNDIKVYPRAFEVPGADWIVVPKTAYVYGKGMRILGITKFL